MFRHSSRFSLLICLTLCICLLSACGAQSETPETAVTNALNAVKALDTATMQKYFDPDDQIMTASKDEDMSDSDKIFLEAIVKNLNFEILSSSTDGDKATVSVAITNTDLRDIFAQFMQLSIQDALQYAFLPEDQQPSDEEMDAMYMQHFQDLMAKEDNPTITTNIDIHLTKAENSWIINSDTLLLDAIFGGFLSAMQNMASSLGGLAE